ncbi:MAG: hypothetical protein Q7T82_04445 [Armatimonadota bacterium]|nr:hypothetical protein [Armatimonadota bacterium]
MITLNGTGICKGVGIAEAVVISGPGLESLPDELVRRGIQAIRRGEPESELPAVVIICDSLANSSDFRLPGLRVAALAAESNGDSGPFCEAPSVAGVDDLLRNVAGGDMVIVDGTQGIVHIDPDAETLMRYQNLEGHEKKRRVFLGSAHLPAATQDGRTILALATITRAADSAAALVEGADGIVLTPSAVDEFAGEDWARLCDESGGKAIMLLSAPDDDAFANLVEHALPLQITIAAPLGQERRIAELRELMARLSDELADRGLDASEVAFGVVVDAASEYEDGYAAVSASRLVIDAGSCDASLTQSELSGCIRAAMSARASDARELEPGDPAFQAEIPTTILLGLSIDSVRYLATAGVDSVAVPLGLVAATKDLVRSIRAED